MGGPHGTAARCVFVQGYRRVPFIGRPYAHGAFRGDRPQQGVRVRKELKRKLSQDTNGELFVRRHPQEHSGAALAASGGFEGK